jgi:hypothetical protein
MVGKPASALLTLIVLSSALCTSLPCSAGPGDGKPMERVRNEYPAAVKRLKEAYSHVRGSGTITEVHQSKSKGSTTSVTKFTFIVDGGNIKVSKELDSLPSAAVKDKYTVSSSNTNYNFRADAPVKNDPVVLRKLQPGRGSVYHELDNFRFTYVMAPFNMAGTIDEFLWDPAITKISQVTPVTKAGADLFRVEFTREMSLQNEPTVMKCWLEVAPDNGWVLMEHGRTGKKHFDSSTKIEYGPAVDGVPVPKRITNEWATRRVTVEFDEFTFTRSSVGDFTLNSVGLPEVPLPGRGRWGLVWLFNLVFGGILLAVVVVRSRMRRGLERPPLPMGGVSE